MNNIKEIESTSLIYRNLPTSRIADSREFGQKPLENARESEFFPREIEFLRFYHISCLLMFIDLKSNQLNTLIYSSP